MRTAGVFLATLVASSAFAQSSSPATGEATTYDIELMEGDNLVSLPVLPDTSSVGLIVAEILQALTLVQDDMGRYFMPAQDIRDLEAWSWEDAYSVKVSAPVTLTVAGAEILPESSPVPLEAEVGNWVPYLQNRSLPVEEALASIADHLFKVEDGAGRLYQPGNEDSSLDSLHVGRGYRVWVSEPDTLLYPANLTEEGDTVSPTCVFGPLNPGPPQNRDLTVADAGSGIVTIQITDATTNAVVEIPKGSGDFFSAGDVASFAPPEAGPITANVLQTNAGEAAEIGLTVTDGAGNARTCTSEIPASDPGGPVTQVGTIGQALVLTGLEEGQLIEVLGYYHPGDGGGGTFRVENSGAVPDGGTVFVPDEHASALLEETQVVGHNTLDALPPGQDLIYGSIHVEVRVTATGETIFSASDRSFHGHEHTSSSLPRTFFYYDEGRYYDVHHRLGNHCEHLTGSETACEQTITYRHTTSNLRLHRMNVGEVLNVGWFGARTASEQPGFDNQPILNHTINVARRLNEAEPGRITTILFPKTEVYEYYGSVQLADGLTIRGSGGTELVTVTNDLGHTYSPVRLKPVRTTLRVPNGKALEYIRMRKSMSDPNFITPDTKRVLRHSPTAIYLAPGAMNGGLEDIVLDGNWEGNTQAWEEGWATFAERETYMRDSPGWSGFISTNHGNVEIPVGQQITLRNVAITGFGATNVLGQANNTWDAENVRLGNVLWNHAFYSANGTWTNLTFEGFAWTQAVWTAGTITNLVYEDGAPAPYRQGPDLINIRGGDTYSEDDPEGHFGRVTRSDGSVIDLGTVIDGFYFDLRGSDISQPFNGLGPDVEIRNGMIAAVHIQDLFNENGNGLQQGLYPNYRFENITVHGGGRLFGTMNTTLGLFRNITKTSELPGSNESGFHTFKLRAERRDRSVWDTRQVNVFSDIHHDTPHDFLASVAIREDVAGIDYFVLRSRFNNQTNTIYRNDSGNGTNSTLEGDFSKLRVYMDDVEFNIPGSLYFFNLQNFLSLTHFRNVTEAQSSRTSENSGTVNLTADGGETFIDVDPGLWWVPLEEEYVTYGGPDAYLIASVLPECPDTHSDVQDAFGLPTANRDDRRDCALRFTLTRSLSAGETVTFDWTAAINPWPEAVTVPAYAE